MGLPCSIEREETEDCMITVSTLSVATGKDHHEYVSPIALDHGTFFTVLVFMLTEGH